MSFQPHTARLEQANFRHLVFDIAWYGLGLAALSRFLQIYAIHVGATPTELGLLTALPPLIIMLAAFTGAGWRKRFNSSVQAHRLPGLIYRLQFLLPALTPFLPLQLQPLWLVLCMTVPAIPQGLAGLLFIGVLREAVTPEQMPRLLSQRSLWFSITLAIGSVVFGVWLEKMPYPINYQIMFVISFVLVLFSFFHANATRPVVEVKPQPEVSRPKTKPWRSPAFREVALVSVAAQIPFTILIAVIPLYLVQRMQATEGFMALFGLVELSAGAVASLVAPRLVRRIGNRSMVAMMMGGTALSALAFALAPSLPFTLIGAALSGACWTAAAMIGIFGVFTERAPTDDIAYSTAYSQINNLAAFVGPMLGSALVAGGLDLLTVLLVGAALRGGAMLVIDYPRMVRARRALPASAKP